MPRPSMRTIAIVAGAVVAVGLLAAGAWLWSGAQQRKGSSAYAEALILARPSQNPQVPADARMRVILGLERVLVEYPSNAMAGEAAYELGNLRYTIGEYDKARAAWQVAIARAGGIGTVTTLARAGIGYAWEAERKFPEATRAYEAALAELKPTAFYYEVLLVDLARTQELTGQKGAAAATYRRILKDLPKSVRSEEVRNRLGGLGVAP